MTANTDEILDIAIIGGGISGLYAGWRLLTGKPKADSSMPGKRVVVFEGSKRTGGRLLTWRPFANDPNPEKAALHAELGGMRFFRQQQLVWNLINQHFVPTGKLQSPIDFYVSDPNGNNIWYLREHILRTADLSNPEKVPYRLDARAQYTDPSSIINDIIGQILAENLSVITERLNGKTRPENWEDWDKIKPHLHYRNRRLWDIGFWNLLWDLLSPETYAYVTDAFGYYSVTNNWNAAEAMQYISADFTQNPCYQTLREGYDYLPWLIREEFKQAGGEVRFDQRVSAIDRASDGTLEVRIAGADRPVLARHVILAMPRRSLELLEKTTLWNPEKVIAKEKTLGEHIRSVIPYPAFKLFLIYQNQWWHEEPINITTGRSVCDLPIRQTYYFPQPLSSGCSPNPREMSADTESQLETDGIGIVMASYNDLTTVAFWRALEAPEDRKAQLKQKMKNLLNQVQENSPTQERTGASSWKAHANETLKALKEEPGFHLAPPEMVRYAQEQLQLVHLNHPLPDPIYQKDEGALLAAYKDWGHDPYGGGWNFWAPHVEVQQVMEQMRRPFKNENVYIIGDAYSGVQGWVEGALTTAEKMLRDHFHLTEEPWQPKGYYMGY